MADRRAARQKRDPSAADSLRSVIDLYFELAGNELRTADDRQKAFERLLPKQWWARRIHDITRKEVVALLDDIQKDRGRVMAHNFLAYLRKVFNWYCVRDETFISPIVRGMGRIQPGKHRRQRVLSDAELHAVWQAAEELKLRGISKEGGMTAIGVYAWFIQFLLLTGVRRENGARAQWHEVTPDRYIVPPERYKTDKHLVVPLSSAAQDLLATMPKLSKRWLFSTGKPKKKFDERVIEILRRDDPHAKLKGWTVHDLRRTARTLMSRAGVPYDIAERCIGHSLGAMQETYDVYAYFEQKQQAFEALAQLIKRIVENDATPTTQPRVQRHRGVAEWGNAATPAS